MERPYNVLELYGSHARDAIVKRVKRPINYFSIDANYEDGLISRRKPAEVVKRKAGSSSFTHISDYFEIWRPAGLKQIAKHTNNALFDEIHIHMPEGPFGENFLKKIASLLKPNGRIYASFDYHGLGGFKPKNEYEEKPEDHIRIFDGVDAPKPNDNYFTQDKEALVSHLEEHGLKLERYGARSAQKEDDFWRLHPPSRSPSKIQEKLRQLIPNYSDYDQKTQLRHFFIARRK